MASPWGGCGRRAGPRERPEGWLRQRMSLKKLPNDIIGGQAVGRPAGQPRVELAAAAGPVVAEAADDAGGELRPFAPRKGEGAEAPSSSRSAGCPGGQPRAAAQRRSV